MLSCIDSKCSQFLCHRKAELSTGLCPTCNRTYLAEDNGDVCILCGRGDVTLDSIMTFIMDAPLDYLKCNHWACEGCWTERFARGEFNCHSCDQDVFVVMQQSYNTSGVIPVWNVDAIDGEGETTDDEDETTDYEDETTEEEDETTNEESETINGEDGEYEEYEEYEEESWK